MNSVDIAVVGSGASGIAAAVMAARAGRSTLLLDQHASAGGTGGFSGLTTLCGLYDDQGQMLNEGFPVEFVQSLSSAKAARMGKVWVLPYRPERFRQIAASFLEATANLETWWSTALSEVKVADDRIVSLNGLNVGAVIDCTGTAEVARATGASCLETDDNTQAPAVIFPLYHVTCELDTPAANARVLLPLARAGFPPVNFQLGPDPDMLTAKFTGPPDQVEELIKFLQTEIHGFENCATPVSNFVEAKRAGRMIVGRYLLTGADLLGARTFPDTVARCSWPIEQWSRDGKVSYRYLAPGAYYEIPARCLQALSPHNLFMAGKSLSADVDAIASARVMGCCLATGAAAGNLAAKWLESTTE